MDHGNQSEAISFLNQLVKIPSISGNEREIAIFLKQFLEKAGFQMIQSNGNNVIGIKGIGNPVLLLASHMDTVTTYNPFHEDDNFIYGTGVIDCKGSLASMVYSASTIPWKDNQGTLIVAGLEHEEDSMIGVEDLFQRLPNVPDMAIFGEPTQSDRICIGYRGRVWIKVKVLTKSGHTACSWDLDNAILILYELYQKIQQYTDLFNKQHEQHVVSTKCSDPKCGENNNKNNNNINLVDKKKENNKEDPPEESKFQELTVNISTIHAGNEGNSLPRECIADIDIRIPPSISAERLIQSLNEIVNNFKLTNPFKQETAIELKIESQYDAVEILPNQYGSNALRWAIFQVTKRKVSLLKKTGSSFTNIIQHFYRKSNPDFICLTYGPGNSRLEHTDNEVLPKKEYIETIEIYQKFFGKFLEFYQKNKKL